MKWHRGARQLDVTTTSPNAERRGRGGADYHDTHAGRTTPARPARETAAPPCGVPRSHGPSPRPASEKERPARQVPGPADRGKISVGGRGREPDSEPGRRHKGRGHLCSGRRLAAAGGFAAALRMALRLVRRGAAASFSATFSGPLARGSEQAPPIAATRRPTSNGPSTAPRSV